jgi:hypothetical protein
VITTNKRVETFIDNDSDRFSDIEHKMLDLERDISEWREARTREFLRVTPRPQERPQQRAERRGEDRREAGRSGDRAADRAQELIERGRRTARPRRSRLSRKMVLGSAAGLTAAVIGALILFRPGPSWPASVATVQSEITAACQNPDVPSEPGQVNFACGQDTRQVLWVFALLTSTDNPAYADAKTGRKGLEPITPAQGGQIAWSLNLHHPYDPLNPVDSLAVAARAINNIIGGATVTATNGSLTVEPGLESKPENCARYTGSAAIVSRAGYPSRCATPVASPEGQAALVADVYQQWMPGASAVAAQNASVLFANAGDPGNSQVQAILATLPKPGRS